MNLEIVLIGGLIAWRLATLLSRENGPRNIFARLRAFLARQQTHKGGLFDMISCTACTTMTTGAVTALALAGSVLEWIGYTLAFSAFATIIERLLRRDG